ncbi:MAG: type VI secretion system-associated FHA domain protein TagH, partial [Chitinophagaceae bacterium]|nr:type VI secretion system-associated FHA domain protein TagH [Rubrivivax sp.]
LSHGDEVRIGGYLLRVECRAQQTAVDITRGRAVVSDGMVPLAPRTGGDPFADLRGNAGPASAVANTSHAPAAATAPVRPAGAPSVNPTDGHALWAALCEGAGIDLPLSLDDPEERMREVGRILRSAVEGTLRLMTVRASTKHELRAAVTVIQADGNNPLKFSPDAKSGLEYLLQPGVRGFLEGPAAMDDAMHDLVGHSIGTVAGMRAAIAGMLERFAPCELEAKLVGRPMLDSMLPINRKARLWDLYLQHHDTIREEAQEDFHAMFGKAFVAAYDQEMAQLQRKPR